MPPNQSEKPRMLFLWKGIIKTIYLFFFIKYFRLITYMLTKAGKQYILFIKSIFFFFLDLLSRKSRKRKSWLSKQLLRTWLIQILKQLLRNHSMNQGRINLFNYFLTTIDDSWNVCHFKTFSVNKLGTRENKETHT